VAARILVYAVWGVLALSSCNYRVDKTGGANGASEQKANGGVDFKLVSESILIPKCVECHAQYRDYGNVKFEISSIRTQIESNRMPKGSGPLSSEQKALLIAWAEAGAPETLGSGGGVGVPDPSPPQLEVNYQSISRAIFNPKCTACHNPQGQAKFLDLSSRLTIFNQRNRVFGAGAGQKLIDFDTPESSYLLTVIKDPVEPMPPAWSGLSRLSVHETDILQQWIQLGLP
jgi:mono/diheme cytochrome c family protein